MRAAAAEPPAAPLDDAPEVACLIPAQEPELLSHGPLLSQLGRAVVPQSRLRATVVARPGKGLRMASCISIEVHVFA
jgi:hypothetical protein